MPRSIAPSPSIDCANLFGSELGHRGIVRPDNPALEDYGRDESYLRGYSPECAVLCESREQVHIALRLAKEHGIPVTPRGAGSGMTGGAIPVRGGIVLSTERMTKIIDIDIDDLVAVVEPGTILGDLQDAVDDQGLFYPPDPASLAMCSVGGNVATNAGGPRAFKYGVTREYVLGLEVVLMGGEVLRCGRRTAKGVSGYDLVGGFVGTEGTFAVSTEITLKLLPRPPGVSTLLAVFPSMTAAGAAISDLLRTGFRPRTLEIMDRASIDHVRPKARFRFPADAGAAALIEIDGPEDGLESQLIAVGELCEGQGAVDVVVAQDAQARRALWEARRICSQSLKAGHRHKINEDICVPRGALVEMLARIDTIAAGAGFPVATFGHAGDGNLHVNILCDDDMADHAVHQRIDRCVAQLFAATIDLRGTLSGEHGIGLAKARYMPLEHSDRALHWQRQWKAMWDPDNLLNPGKIFPDNPMTAQWRCVE